MHKQAQISCVPTNTNLNACHPSWLKWDWWTLQLTNQNIYWFNDGVSFLFIYETNVLKLKSLNILLGANWFPFPVSASKRYAKMFSRIRFPNNKDNNRRFWVWVNFPFCSQTSCVPPIFFLVIEMHSLTYYKVDLNKYKYQISTEENVSSGSKNHWLPICKSIYFL